MGEPRFRIAACNDLVASISPKTGTIIGSRSQVGMNILAREQLQCAVELIGHIDEKLREIDAFMSQCAMPGQEPAEDGPMATVRKLIRDIAAGRVNWDAYAKPVPITPEQAGPDNSGGDW